MQEIIQQFINQIEQDQRYSFNTKSSYKSDLNELLEYIISTNTKPNDINQNWVKNHLKHLEETNKERNSFNRRASTFRLFLKFLYKNKLAPTNYSLIVNNLPIFLKSQEEINRDALKKTIEESKLKITDRLILLLIGRLGLSATQIASLNTYQIDFDAKAIAISDTQKVILPQEVFTILREYLLETRENLQGSSKHLSLFLNDKGNELREGDIYKLIRKLREELNLELTTRKLKGSLETKNDILSMQQELLSVIAP